MGLALLLLGCEAAPDHEPPPPAESAPREAPVDRAGPQPAPDTVGVVFTRDEAPVTVQRAVPPESAGLRTALEQLLAGPTAEERAGGIDSWFSAETSEALESVEVVSGHAVVDFRDLRSLIPNASSSAGSAMLLQELNGTVFQFPEIRSVEYRVEGSCDLFWNWLQYDCEVVTRPGG